MKPAVLSLFALLSFASVACGAVASSTTPTPAHDDSTNNLDDLADASPASDAGADAYESFDAFPTSCDYRDDLGTITVTAIGAPGPNETPCTGSEDRGVEFSFTPDDPSAPAVRAELSTYDVASRMLRWKGRSVPQVCLTQLGVVVGSTFRATRRLQTNGTCTPVAYDAPIVAMEGCTVTCNP